MKRLVIALCLVLGNCAASAPAFAGVCHAN